MKNEVKNAAKKAGKLWVAKKGLQWTGSFLKIGLIAGAGYLAYQYIRDNQEEIRAKFSS